jgi:hypothetical protein
MLLTNSTPVPDIQNGAFQLRDVGYARIQNCEALYQQNTQNYFSEMIERYGVDALLRFSFECEKRDDKRYEPDDGFLHRNASYSSKDTKYIFHYRPRLWALIHKRGLEHPYERTIHSDICSFMKLCHETYVLHRDLMVALMDVFDSLNVLPCSLREAVQKSLDYPMPTSRSVLRLLHYPPQREGVCARVHFDRAFLTIHAGGEGGNLFIRHQNGEEEVIVTRQNEVFVFWGAKAKIIAAEHGGVLTPTAHGSCGNKNELRRATVSFWHINKVLFDAPNVLY